MTQIDSSTITLEERLSNTSVYSAYTHAGERVAVLMPNLKTNAPARWRRVYFDRIECNFTGICPRCKAVIGTDVQGEFSVQTDHEEGCPVIDTNLGRWIKDLQ